MKDFDCKIDYYSQLRANEVWTDDKGGEYPLLAGLLRLAHENRGGIKSVRSKVVKVPSIGKDGDTISPDCIAAVTVTYEFIDGSIFEGSADASFVAHKSPYNLHLTAVAEAKAEARAIRRAFMITKVAKQEIGDARSEIAGEPDTGPITDVQINGIKKVAKRKKLGQEDVLRLVKRKDLTEISQLTAEEGRKALKAISRHKGKN